jgi:hypothetical protein
MDKLERIGHLVLEALAKARQLATLPLDADSRAKAADLMRNANESHKKMEALSQASESNGKGLDKATLDAALDDLIKTFEDVNRKLDDLLAKAKS